MARPASRHRPRALAGIALLLPLLGVGLASGPTLRAEDAPAARAGAPATPAVEASRAAEAAWLDDEGTALLGFGLLRVAPLGPPSEARAAARVRIHYEEEPSDYAAFDAVQLLVLPGEAFATAGHAFAGACLAYARSERGTYASTVDLVVDRPRLLLVAYGPFTSPDTGRPLSLRRAWKLEVTDAGGVARRWVAPEAGELTVKSWTNRPEVTRGDPVTDPVTRKPHWFEVRPELFYDPERLAAPEDPAPSQVLARRREADSLRARADDLEAAGKADAARELRREADDLLTSLEDDRVPVPAALAERLRRIPFRWK